MPFHRCTISQEDGTVVAQDVDIAIHVTGQDEAAEWHGTLTVTHLTTLDAGQKYRLTLDDGRSGDFVVRRNTFAGGMNRAVAIRGMSPLK